MPPAVAVAQHAKQIESMLDPGRCAAEGEYERARELEHDERARRVRLESGQCLQEVFSA